THCATPLTRSSSEDQMSDPKTEVLTKGGASVADPRPQQDAPPLEVKDLHVEFRTRAGVANAVNGVSFKVEAGETLAILGESGCGKSVTAQAVMGILETPPAAITGGQVLYRGTDLLTLPEKERRDFRAQKISMIFQDALSA